MKEAVEAFLAERHLATLTTLRPDGSPHVVPVRFTWDGTLARVMTVASSRKVRNLTAGPYDRAALCQVAGVRWVTLEGAATARRTRCASPKAHAATPNASVPHHRIRPAASWSRSRLTA